MQKGKADSVSILSSLPEDVALKIASLLQVVVRGSGGNSASQIAFGSLLSETDGPYSLPSISLLLPLILPISRYPPLILLYWRNTLFVFQPCLYKVLYFSLLVSELGLWKWRKLYLERQVELGLRARSVVKFLEACSRSESLEVGDYLKAVDTLIGTMFGFEDVQRFLFNPQMNVLINLVGLHYCLTTLGIPGDNLVEALRTHEISDRRVCIKWWKVGRWYYGFRMRDESHSRWVSLADLATEDDEHVLGVLRRGTVHEVLRVQISVVGRPSTPWSCQITQRLE
ncbi:hypothetical protein GmHk_07G020709 [Glycine max]|nr:hypothetical protein JHK85_020248 [Glycine max]KAH1243684.1 hypothetical protein GmHk_07G020709 [Glycine max]